MGDELSASPLGHDELAETQPYMDGAQAASHAAVLINGAKPQKSSESFETLMMSSSSLDPVDATLSPSKHTKILPRRDKQLLEELKGPAAQRPRISPFTPFSFQFGNEKESNRAAENPSRRSSSPPAAPPAAIVPTDDYNRKSSVSSELEAPAAASAKSPVRALKAVRKNYAKSPDAHASPGKSPLQPPRVARESSPELPPTPVRRAPLPGAPASAIPSTPPAPSSHARAPSIPLESSSLQLNERPLGSVPSSALSQSQQSSQNEPVPSCKETRKQKSGSAASSQESELLVPAPRHDEPSELSDEKRESQSSQHQPKRIAQSSQDSTPSKRRRVPSSQPRSQAEQSDKSDQESDRRVTRLSQHHSQGSRTSAEKEESCLPRDEEEEELLSQHSQRSVPKTLSKASKKRGQRPIHSVATLFRGLRFLVTGLQPVNETEAKEYDDNLRLTICESITSRGGLLEEDIERVHPRDRKSAYPDVPALLLISDRARTTIKYLSALAAGVPCVHYLWLEHCISSKLIVPCREYLLPAGFSQSLQKVLTHEDFTTPNAMDGLRVEILGGANYVNIWSKIVRAAGGKCVRRLFTADEEHIDVICSPEDYLVTIHVRNKAAELKKPLVSLQWIKQCLVDRRMVPFRPFAIANKK